ncbi:PP2C family serine/threonine-protein phosphatase [Cellvibrio sp. KY-YJ-3]|jgi:serine/threonine protein phosphatase PrpC|uniref:PP2C family protein-serine/threonine phosphatase n=1 Tax=Cellvibrio sp. KY-YJ-3 TaxID=454662 RepID=UPI00124704E8|nr:protein phosphatase 2C domain-containing protein [Cellvibrio sp. KY-YJ-3]QEY12940.1 serine/threonine-protein phosphatase [Cellvibrio sp. KY-YJ-3]
MTIKPLDYSAASHPGLTRSNNEDCFLSKPEQGLWLVADGMGGHEAGEVASALVRDTIERNTRNNPHLSLLDAIQQAHLSIINSAKQGIGAPGMGSTVVALKSQDQRYQIAWVGDSRAYLWTPSREGGRLEQLSTDHSYVQMLVESGAIRAEDAEFHPEKNIITQCLGMQELAQVKVDHLENQWQENQWILLCSDGLTDEVNDKTIAQILCDASDCVAAVDQLMHAALTNGGRDNITLQIIESPLRPADQGNGLWQFVPHLTGNLKRDAWIFGASLVSLLGLLVYVVLT